MSTATFLEAYHEATLENPLRSCERIHAMRVVLHLYASGLGGANHVWLSSIRSAYRGQGHASQTLRWLCDLADQHGVRISLHYVPFGMLRPRLTQAQLRTWYLRHGFKKTDARRTLIRYPKLLQQNVESPDIVLHQISVAGS